MTSIPPFLSAYIACRSTPDTTPSWFLSRIQAHRHGRICRAPTLPQLLHLRPAGSSLLLSPNSPPSLFLTILILIITIIIITTPPPLSICFLRHLHLHTISPAGVWLLGRGCFIRLLVRGRQLLIRLRLRRFIRSLPAWDRVMVMVMVMVTRDIPGCPDGSKGISWERGWEIGRDRGRGKGSGKGEGNGRGPRCGIVKIKLNSYRDVSSIGNIFKNISRRHTPNHKHNPPRNQQHSLYLHTYQALCLKSKQKQNRSRYRSRPPSLNLGFPERSTWCLKAG